MMRLKRMLDLPTRCVFCILTFVGFIFNYMLRTNINYTIAYMINHTVLLNSSNVSTHIRQDGSFNSMVIFDATINNTAQDGAFLWDAKMRNHVVESFYWGYFLLQVPGGRIADIYGGKNVLSVSMGATALLTMLVPGVSNLYGSEGYPYPLVVSRVVMGLLEGAMFPCIISMLGKWAPEAERSIMTTFIFTGSQIGIVIANQMSHLVAGSLGWESVFYIQGSCCFLWLLAWILWSSDSPSTHKSMSPEEKKYIEVNLPSTSATSLPLPLWRMLRSAPFWAILVANVGHNWGFHIIMTSMPHYFMAVFHTDLFQLSWLSALPHACMWLFSLLVACSADHWISRSKSPATVRKICTSLGHGGSSICLLVIIASVTAENKQEMLSGVMFTLAVTLQGAALSGFVVNALDIAPNFAGTIVGIASSVGSIASWAAPFMVGEVISGEGAQDVNRWRYVWVAAVAVMLGELWFFVLFAQGNPQKWNESEGEFNPTEDQNEGDKADEVKLTRFSICSTNSGFAIN